MTDVEGRIRITAKDESAPAFSALSKRMEALHKIGQRLAARTGLPQISEGLRGMTEHLRQVHERIAPVIEGLAALSGITVVAGIGGVAEAIRSTAENMERLGRTSKQLDVAAQTLDRVDAVAEKLGVNSDVMNGALREAGKNWEMIRHHVGRLPEQLARLDPQLLGAIRGAGSASKAYVVMLDYIEKQQPAMRTALEQKMFGTDAIDPVLQFGGANFHRALEEAGKDRGDVTSAMLDSASQLMDASWRMQNSFTGLGRVIEDRVAPPLTKMMNGLADYLTANRDFIGDKIGTGITALGTALQNFDWKGMGRDLADIARAMNSVVDGLKWLSEHDPSPLAARAGRASGDFLGTSRFGPWLYDKLGYDSGTGTANADGKGDLGRASISAPGIAHAYRGMGTGGRRASLLGRLNDWFSGPEVPPFAKGDLPAGLKFHAAGGPIARGGWSVVGERGPEMVNWGASGGVMSNLNSMSFTTALRVAFEQLPSVLTDLTRVLAQFADKMTRNTPNLPGAGGGAGGYGGGGNGGGSGPADYGASSASFPDRSHGDQRLGALAGSYRLPPGKLTALPNAGNMSNAVGVYNMMRRIGIGRDAAVGAMAGVMGESGHGMSANPPGWNDGGTSGGMAQWHAGRFAGLKRFADGMHKAWTDPSVQIAWMEKELTTGKYANVLAALKRAHSAQEATAIWTRFYEAPLVDNSGARMGNIPYAVRAANIADQQAQKVDIGKGEMTIHLVPNGHQVSRISSNASGNFNQTVAIDTTGIRRFNRGMN